MNILGIGPVCSLGSGIIEFEQGLINNKIPGDYCNINLQKLANFIPPRRLRRLDDFSKTALLSAFLAVEDSGIKLTNPDRVGIVIGTGNGPLNTTFEFLDNIIAYGDESSSPLLFANSVHNAPASHISMIFRITGPSSTITCFEQTLSNVLITAESWLKTGLVDYVIAGVGDENHEAAAYSIEKMQSKKQKVKQQEKPDKIKPFVLEKSSYIPGAGFITFLLGSETGYCSLKTKAVRNSVSSDIFNNSDYLILSANGNCRLNSTIKKLSFNKPLTAFSPLYGSMMTGTGFDIAIAALSVKNRRLLPSPSTETDFADNFNIIAKEVILDENNTIGCIETGEIDEYNYYEISS